jgi:hypothetical protein
MRIISNEAFGVWGPKNLWEKNTMGSQNDFVIDEMELSMK